MNINSVVDILGTAFNPRAIAVVGASEDVLSFGYRFMSYLLGYGYSGQIYPVNPKKKTVFGLEAYPSLSSVPGQVDYVICCLPAVKVLDLLGECPSRGVKVVHLVTARLAETGRREARELEVKILQEARRLNIRLIGPNCMGIYNPRQGLAFNDELPKEAGSVGAIIQSGGLSGLLVRYGELQGLRFSKAVSYGNALDLDESDFLQYLTQDTDTSIIAAYIEGVKDGRKLLNALAEAARVKPVIALKGGRGSAGIKAASSHTAAIAGTDIVWESVFRQTGTIQVQDLNELVNLLVVFSFLSPLKGKKVGIIGGGGGKGVISTDACENAGLIVPPLPSEIRDNLRENAPEIWDWLGNPVDLSIMEGASISRKEILRMMVTSPYFDVIIASITEDAPLAEDSFSDFIREETEDIIMISRERLKPIVAVVSGAKVHSDQFQKWHWKFIAEQQARLVDAQVPTYSTMTEAAKALRQFTDYCCRAVEA